MNFRSSSVLLQVALVAAAAVAATQLVTLAIIFLAPSPAPTGYTLAAAAAALNGEPARTADGRLLVRELSDGEPLEQGTSSLAKAAARSLAVEMGLDVRRIRVQSDRRARERFGPRPEVVRPSAGPLPAPGDKPQGLFSAQQTLPPFLAAVQLDDGRWAMVRIPKSLLAPWEITILLGMLVSLIVLAPLIWWMARRLARPIHRFAMAADRLGADPDAPPLMSDGPNEVRLAVSAFNEMQARLREHIQRRTQTVAAVAHDLRTPLTRLRFRVEELPARYRPDMSADIEEMDTLIARAMQFAKGDFAADQREVLDISDLVQATVNRYVETGAAMNIAVEPGLRVEADASALRRGLTNLIDNALAYGGPVTVTARADGDQALVQVRDNGPGIPPDLLERVFDPFFRIEISRSRQTGGAGLGLAIARHAIRAHGGDVKLRNNPDGGLEADLFLPLLGTRRVQP
ncbi:sensor histidine kinase [Brevundimonas lenta]|uniref:histidine kinase n=1 Tax=Brevundimonas lenta TaxID=424796 RepID=A0A7W6NPR6_9CAUL|nr:ATP-binding protein [Brevundimonas lenta]MBB4083163.1 signal transduction histidine kinase [Brevundimonas lenta]